jgi:hypothetical protein
MYVGDTVLVVAGNFHQAIRFAKNHNLSPDDWKYIAGSADLMGYGGVKLVKVGEWWKHPYLGAVLDACKTRNITVVDENRFTP